ncbi:MAG: quinol dehydrogenase ferredoxin subunit NapH, partial [Rhodobacteraceae bacterium]|nr:quinol dehydrogenase ferredoxin subunit NapH [Paracoccaceae bacterium]
MSRRAHQNAYAKAGREAAAVKGWLGAHKWLLARRAAQFGFLALFLAGPVAGWWLVKGNMASSLTLGWLELTDPLVLLQSALAGHTIAGAALGGAAIVFVVYALIGGRVYCSWVCPVNIVTDGAHWGRQKLGLRGGVRPSRRTRYWLLGATLVVAAATGTIAWELVNPVSMIYRGLIFGLGAAWIFIAALLALDLIVGNRL